MAAPMRAPQQLKRLEIESTTMTRSSSLRELEEALVLQAVVDEFLVDLVADEEEVVLDGQIDDALAAPRASRPMPVGLLGEQRTMARVRGVILASNSAAGGRR